MGWVLDSYIMTQMVSNNTQIQKQVTNSHVTKWRVMGSHRTNLITPSNTSDKLWEFISIQYSSRNTSERQENLDHNEQTFVFCRNTSKISFGNLSVCNVDAYMYWNFKVSRIRLWFSCSFYKASKRMGKIPGECNNMNGMMLQQSDIIDAWRWFMRRF